VWSEVCDKQKLIVYGVENRRDKRRRRIMARSEYQQATNKEFGEFLVNLLKPTGYVMHHQFIIKQLYGLPTLHLCVLYSSENKQRLGPLTA